MTRTCNCTACTWTAMVALLAAPAVEAGDAARDLRAAATGSPLERRFLSPPARITEGMTRAGEGYVSPGMRLISYQAVPPGRQFYEIFVQDFDPGDPRPQPPRRVSPGRGRTTCSWFTPDGSRLLFASSHLDPDASATEEAARAAAEEDARAGRRRKYQWDFDPRMDIFTARLDGTDLVRLTTEAGYDAECSFSPDGSSVLFVSDRDGDPDLYVMEADGSGVRQLTDRPGYDGGPFFSPDGRWIAYRTDTVEKERLQIHVMRADGGGDVPLTAGAGVRWAPFWHPTRPWLIWTGADHGDPTARPNYDLWIAAWTVAADGSFVAGEPLRITDHPGADVLPAFSPDGTMLVWTASRGDEAGGRGPASQLWASRLDLDAVAAAVPPPRPGPTDGSQR